MPVDNLFSPTDEVASPNIDLRSNVEQDSEDNEQVLEEEGSDHEIDCEDVFGIESNDLENEGEEFFRIGSNDIENGSDLVIEIDTADNEQMHEFRSNDLQNKDQLIENGKDDDTKLIEDQQGLSQVENYPPPVLGMEFDSYDDAYNYYNCYGKELGFAIRVKSSWTKRNSKEKRGAVLCCNCEGFKTSKDATNRRKETRTGCLAMIRLRLVESGRWRVDEVKLEHNHLFDPERAQTSKSHKKIDSEPKRKLEPPVDVEVRTIKLYRTPVVDAAGYRISHERAVSNHVTKKTKHLKLKTGDMQVISNFFCRVQLTEPNFLYIMDFNDEGFLRNVFWIDSRARAMYGYFGDVVAIDTTCLSNGYELPLLVFFGVNHHKQSFLLGCGLLVDESLDTYIWILRAWLTCLSGRPPQTVITDCSKVLQTAVAEVFPRAHNRLCISLVTQSIFYKLEKELTESEPFLSTLNSVVYNSVKVDEFELGWEEMIQRFAIRDYAWLRGLYEDRERWAPVYSKDTFFAGMMSTSQSGESLFPFFHGYVHRDTSMQEFFDSYEPFLKKKMQKEALDDFESNTFVPKLRTSCNYESQLSELYSKEVFLAFQDEVEMMSNCVSLSTIQENGSVFTYIIKEREFDGIGSRNFEVMHDRVGVEVRCICSCFSFNGYLCRHSLFVLNSNGIEEVPSQYVLSRWRKDRRMYATEFGCDSIDTSNPVQWFEHLHRRALQVVEEGAKSHEHYTVAWHAFKESLNNVRLNSGDRP